ncbi:hypothetical protein PAPYR_3068 [Paratrimastix pyriformis]|uniref:Uncharacterized protein n=1 Tax=Paratrimastix pyriformis TaxID=342808 RepID=A0ABQ8UNP9_9EUKA|nr:hypothetical protein PAPYR_3068 [Paratrimastix pyriformis]
MRVSHWLIPGGFIPRSCVPGQVFFRSGLHLSASSFGVFLQSPSPRALRSPPVPLGTHFRLWYVSTVLRAYRNPPPTFSLAKYPI